MNEKGAEGAKLQRKVSQCRRPLQSRNWHVAILLQTKSAVLFSVVVEPRKVVTQWKSLWPQAGEGCGRGKRFAARGRSPKVWVWFGLGVRGFCMWRGATRRVGSGLGLG